jgi:hypothetical protein
VVGFALESFLTLLSFPRQRFSIEPFSRAKERWLGADARLTKVRGFRPFYMQFKRPSAYPDYSASKIVKDRKSFSLSTQPRSLFFPLRKKQDSHRDYQHNVLFLLRTRLLQRGLGDAAYICPLFLNRSAYRHSLHWSGLSRWLQFWRHDPWEWEDVLLRDGGRTIAFERLPVLAEHITIPPHALVTSANHSYSFDESGRGLCFHSPQALPEGALSLGKFLSGISQGFLDRGEKLQPAESGGLLLDLIKYAEPESIAKQPQASFDADDPIGSWLAWGDYLSQTYGIEQYALVKWEDATPFDLRGNP